MDARPLREPTEAQHPEAALAAAVAAGAPSSVWDVIQEQLDLAQAQAAAAKPTGARLDSVCVKVAMASTAVHAAEDTLRLAETSLAAALQAKELAEKELAEVHAVARAPAPEAVANAQMDLVQSVRRLLDVSEQNQLPSMAS